MSASVGDGARRLFTDLPEVDFDAPQNRSLLFARLLENGDGTDLSTLARSFPEGEIGDWFERLGGRKLSSRSQAFWSIVLGRRAGGADPGASELWPL